MWGLGGSFVVLIIVILIYVLIIALLVKMWNMTKDVRELKMHILNQQGIISREQEAKIAFLKGENDRAKDLLDAAYFEELLNAKDDLYGYQIYDSEHFNISKKYDRLYYSMNLQKLDFELYADPRNLP